MYRPPADLFRNRIAGGRYYFEIDPPGAIFRPADLFRGTGVAERFRKPAASRIGRDQPNSREKCMISRQNF